MRRFDATGAAVTDETAVGQSFRDGVEVSMADDGSFVVGWLGSSNDAFLRRYDSAGTPIAPAIDVGLDPVPKLFIRHLPDGAFLAFSRYGGVRVFDDSGVPVRTDEIVQFPQDILDGCTTLGGDLIVVGYEHPAVFVEGEFLARRYRPADGSVGPPFVVNAYTEGFEMNPSIACMGEDGFVVSWQTDLQYQTIEGDLTGLYARHFVAPEVPLTDDFPVNLMRRGSQEAVDSAAAGGRLFFAWQSREQYSVPDPIVHHRVLCDDGDPECRYACPGFDPEDDPDGDGRPVGCDACENLAGAQDLVGKVQAVARSQRFGNARFSKLVFKGEVSLPPSMPGGLSDFDPLTQPLRIFLESEAGYVADITIPPSGNWQSAAEGKKWRYGNNTPEAPGGIYKGVLLDRSGQLPRGVRFSFKGRGSEEHLERIIYPVSYLDRSLHAVLVLGDDSAASNGRCGEVRFSIDRCKTKLKTLSTIGCK